VCVSPIAPWGMCMLVCQKPPPCYRGLCWNLEDADQGVMEYACEISAVANWLATEHPLCKQLQCMCDISATAQGVPVVADSSLQGPYQSAQARDPLAADRERGPSRHVGVVCSYDPQLTRAEEAAVTAGRSLRFGLGSIRKRGQTEDMQSICTAQGVAASVEGVEGRTWESGLFPWMFPCFSLSSSCSQLCPTLHAFDKLACLHRLRNFACRALPLLLRPML